MHVQRKFNYLKSATYKEVDNNKEVYEVFSLRKTSSLSKN